MAILEPADGALPLSQGDILRGIPLHITGIDGGADTPGGEGDFCIVLSRVCSALRDPTVVVAKVVGTTLGLPAKLTEKVETFAELRHRLEAIRDGGGTPDVFYLGELAGTETADARFAARLDHISTIKVPTGEARGEWIRAHRVARLALPFMRDLHVRFLVAFAREGFDDHSWYSDGDLRLLLNFGVEKLRAAQSSVKKAEMALNLAKDGKDFEKQRKSLDPELATAKKADAKIRVEIEDFRLSWLARHPGDDPLLW